MISSWPFDEPLLVDRAAQRRRDMEPGTCAALVIRDGALLMRGGAPALLPRDTRPVAEVEAFLGVVDGEDIVVASVGSDWQPRESDGDLVPMGEALRELHRRADGSLDARAMRNRELGSSAAAIIAWHDRNPRCSLCGGPTEVRDSGWIRHCPADGREHYPRTDPAVIVAITDDNDRLLLAHVSYHSERRYTHLAGYVEPGESLEQAVHREVGEEAQLSVRDLEYVGSQPWPFPASLMVAYRARAVSTEITVDGEEVVDARWFTRAELAAAVADGTIVLAPPGSIARRLIHEWFGRSIGGDADVWNA